ncbi:transcriptional regulator [Capnocytophaga catalasegens]|uniref:Transcriptional regulator n=2 Tax=Capnocytophaga catalasegens TaxID=1004260 RepID=A0AAV5AYR1_9FLAO|nr:transcriptional regulator [Capnocytophaga catalasegens]GJM51136.1 transcriptional regulator [Capnocytophaga catalasegens]GJM53326.1 transcriptional regulator [Capnocytophaga catalasegens]
MQSAQNAVYTEMLPAEKLLPFIYCYWTLKTTSQLAENYSYRVISDGCIDIFFPLENPDESYVMGFCKSYTEFDLGKQFNYIGIRFLPTIFPLIFGQNAKELSNTDVRLSLVLSDLSRIISHKINELQSLQEIKNQLDSIFIKHLQKTDFQIDSRFYNALEIILKRQGNILITNDLDTGLSPRHLRRLFEFYIGDTAKTFSQVVRFQSVLTAKKYSQNTDNQLFYDIDYYDQSHFIKEFKTFYGVTPREAFLNN